MHFELLLKRAREEAEKEANDAYPPSLERNEYRRWLTVKNYLDFISPIRVDEAHYPPHVP